MKQKMLPDAAFAAVLAMGFGLFGGSTGMNAQTPSPAPDQPVPDFRAVVQAAVERHDRRVVIAPGTYRLAPVNHGNVVWPLRNVHDLEIIADGVNLISTVLTRAVALDDCRNVTLQGLTVDYDPLSFTQGTVVATAEDKGSVDVKIHDGYPRQPYARIDVMDPRTRFRKKGMPFLWGSKAAMIGPDTVRLTFPGLGNVAAIGDLVAMSTGPDPSVGGVAHGITVMGCANTVFRNVTVHCAPGMGILEANGEGGAQYLGCKIVPGPPPPDATETRLLTTSWDAMQSATLRKGPLIEDCVIENAGDDSWSMQSADYVVVGKADRTLTVLSRDPYTNGLQTGDRVSLSNHSPEARIIECKAITLGSVKLDDTITNQLREARPWSFWAVSKRGCTLTLDADLPVKVGDSIFSPDRQGIGFVFRHNKLHSSGRILIESGEGLIEGNLIDTGHALVVNPGLPAGAACGVRRLVIRNNVIRQTGFFCPAPWSGQAGAISITGVFKNRDLQRERAYDGIIVEDNLLTGINGPNIVLSSAQNVTIRRNRFVDAQQTAPNDTGKDLGIANDCIVWMTDSAHVQFSDNQVVNLGPFARHILTTDPSVKELTESGTKITGTNPLLNNE